MQVILEGNELGGFSTILTILDGVSGPVIASTLVRVSVRQSVLPLESEKWMLVCPEAMALYGHTVSGTLSGGLWDTTIRL